VTLGRTNEISRNDGEGCKTDSNGYIHVEDRVGPKRGERGGSSMHMKKIKGVGLNNTNCTLEKRSPPKYQIAKKASS